MPGGAATATPATAASGRAFVPLSIDPNSPRPSFYSEECEVDDRDRGIGGGGGELGIEPPAGSNLGRLPSSSASSRSLSHDRLRLMFGLMGMGMLFPYNAVITCVDYFEALHPEERDVAGQLAASTITALLLTTVGLMPLSSPAATGFLASPVRRAFLGYALCFVLLLSVPISPSRRPSTGALNALAFLVGCADATSQSGLYVYAASRGSGPALTAALVFGSAVSGLAVSALRLATRAAFDSTTLDGLAGGVNALFVIGAVVMACCTGALAVTVQDQRCGSDAPMVQVEAVEGGEVELQGERHVDREAETSRRRRDQSVALDDEPANEHSPVLSGKVERRIKGGLKRKSDQKWQALSENDDYGTDSNDVCCDKDAEGNTDMLADTNLQTPPQQQCQHEIARSSVNLRHPVWCCHLMHHPRLEVYVRAFRIVWKTTFSAFLNFFVTLSLFPGTIASIVSQPAGDGGGWGGGIRFGSWLPVVLITTFNAADCAGRAVLNIERLGLSRMLLARHDGAAASSGGEDGEGIQGAPGEDPRPPPPGRPLLPNFDLLVWRHALARLAFYPLVSACVLPSPPRAFLSSDPLRVLVVFLFGFSNGFVNCACFVAAPAVTPAGDGPVRDAASLLVLLAVYGGLMGGAYFGLAVDRILGSVSERSDGAGDF